jgi:RimJ/RimL family protein N-acetyltransferase
MAIKAPARPTEPLLLHAHTTVIVHDQSITSDWQRVLPVLHGAGFRLRELRRADAASLVANLTTSEVSRFITPPPTTLEGFEQFVDYAARRGHEGEFICFAVVPDGVDTAVGIFQLRGLDAQFVSAEWGFALGSRYWGSGLFESGAQLVMRFAFETVGVRRLEARSMVGNLRGNSALRKLGARKDGVLRDSAMKDGCLHDQYLWAILAQDWQQANGGSRPVAADAVPHPWPGADDGEHSGRLLRPQVH